VRVAAWHVEGFGIFSDYASPELPSGLIVLSGPNEAGKSTLLAYIRSMLFGFPTKHGRQQVPLYAPVRGGRRSGRLFLLGEDGRYVIERQDGATKKAVVVTLPDGSLGSEDDLAHLLGNADATLFETVFAFTLRELQELASLTKSDAAERIFSAGLVGAGQSAQKVVADLGSLAGDIYKRQGRGGALREVLDQLAQTETQLVQAREAALGYPRLTAQLAAADRELQERDAQAAIVRDKVARLRSLQKMWSAWSELLATEEELQALGEQGREDEALTGLVAELTLHRERLNRLPSLTAGAERAAADLEARLADLGPGWDTARLAALDASLPARDAVRDWQRRLREAGEGTVAAQREVGKAEDTRLALLSERERWLAHPDVPATQSSVGAGTAARWVMATGAIVGAAVGTALLIAGSTVAGIALLAAALLLGVLAIVLITVRQTDQRVAHATQQRLHGELAGVDARLGEAEQALAREASALSSAQDTAARLDAEWAAWKNSSGVPAALSPEGVIDFFAGVEEARRQHRELARIEGDLVETRRLVGEWEARARAIDAAGAELSGERLAGRVEQLGVAHGRRRELQARVAGFRRTLASGAREGESVEDVRSALAAGEPATWAEEEERLAGELRDLVRAHDAAVEARQDAKTALAALEQSADVAALDARRETLVADLDGIVHQWRRARLAQALLTTTLDQYVEKHQPRVLAEASRLFAAVTDGRYERVVRQGDGSELTVFQRDGTAKPTIDLSRGTAEQLYLCLRLSLAAEFAQRGAALPLIMDDVLVDFDPTRATAVAAVLADFSRERQVLLFTCHPETRDLVVAVAGERATVVELPAPAC
jgi:uncharacterized protein YhaN